jgi:hypothetical protein
MGWRPCVRAQMFYEGSGGLLAEGRLVSLAQEREIGWRPRSSRIDHQA